MAKSQEELLQELIDLQKSNSGNRGGYGAQPTAAPKTGGGVGFSGADMEKAGTTAVGKLGGAAGGIASAIGDSAETWRQASQIGIGFNNDAIGLRGSIAGTRLSTDEWRDSIEKGRQGFTALGGTMSDSAKRFNQLSTEMSNMPVADEMRKIGINTKEYNDVLAISLAGKKFGDFADAESRKKANLAAADLALEMDKVAQLTGVSRREQQEALQEKQKNARVQATVEMQLRAGGQDAADAYKKMTTQMKGMGLDKLSDEIYTGQALSAKSIATLSALGPAGNQLRDAINNVRDAKTKEARDAADIALKKAQAAVAEQVQSDSSLNQIRYGQGEVADALGEISIKSRNYADGIAAVQKESADKGKKLTAEEAQLELDKRANLNKNIASGKAEADARAELAKATNPAEKAAAEEKLKQATAAKTTEAYTLAQARYNDTIAAATILLTKFNTSITAPGAKAGDGLLDKPLKGLANVQTNKKGVESTALDRGGLIGTDRFGKLSEAVEKGDFKAAGTQIGLGAVEVFKNLKDIATGALNVAGDIVYKSAKSDLGSKPAGSYAEGTAGAGFDFTKIVRDFGAKTPVELHGEEAVLTKKQLTDMLAGMQSSIPKMPAGIDMSKLPPIATTISSSTSGGGSTTTSRKQNEESKGAESKISELDKERNAAMSAMTDKMRAVMGPDAKGGEVRRATRDSDEFKAMEAEYTAKREQLQKVVSDGITWETEKKSEAAEELSQAETQKLNRIRYGQDEVAKITETEIAKEVTAAVEKTAKLADAAKTTEAVGAKEVEAKKVVSESSKIMAMQQELIAKGAKIKADGIMGPLTKSAMSAFNTAQVKATDTTKVGNLSKTIPSEVAQAKAEEEKRRAAATTVVPSKPQAETATGPAIKTTQDDLYEQLIQLNTKMQELVSHSSEMATSAEKQVRATKRLDPNVALR
jgi:peptidoglycan hydrolase-like protein with peptidoglycan-binding domain